MRKILLAALAAATLAVPASAQAYPVKGIDTANTISSQQWFDDAYAAGFRVFVFHATNWDDCGEWWNTDATVNRALAAGFDVGVYSRNPNCWQGVIDAVRNRKSELAFVALDIETDPGVQVTRAMVDGIENENMTPVIYTGSGMWPTIMNNSTAFSDVPLWDTSVTGNVTLANWTPSMNTPTPVQYGGWNTSTNKRMGVQQSFETNLNGVNVDLNSFDSTWLANNH